MPPQNPRRHGSKLILKACPAGVISLPKRKDVNLPVNEQLIVELYSK